MTYRFLSLFALGLGLLTFCGPIAHGQQGPSDTPPDNALHISAEKGEICVQGVIQSVDVAHGSFVLAVSAIFPPGGSRVAFTLPRPKTVFVSPQTAIQGANTAGKAPGLSEMAGLGAIVCGQDKGTGNPLPARQIVLWPSQTDAHVQAGGEHFQGTLPRYTITEIGVLPGDIESEAVGLNDKGEVVGQSITTHSDSGDDVGHGLVWKSGQMYNMGASQGFHTSAAFHINNAAQIVGTVDNSGYTVTSRTISRGCWWQSGKVHILPIGPHATGSLAFDLNDHNEIVGTLSLPFSHGDLSAHAALWQGGKLTDLGTLPGYPSASAKAINSQGDIVCSAERFESVGSQVRLLSHAYLWHKGKQTDLGFLPGCNSSRVNAINRAGEIIGQSSAETFQRPLGTQRGFLWKDHHLTELKGLEDGVSGVPFGINDQGDIVGIENVPKAAQDTPGAIGFPTPDFNSTSSDLPATTAVLWRAGRAYNLSQSIPDDSGWHLTSANAVNNHGQVVGDGLHNGKKRGYLLTPLP